MELCSICIGLAQLVFGLVSCLSGKVIDERVVYRMKSPFKHLRARRTVVFVGCWT